MVYRRIAKRRIRKRRRYNRRIRRVVKRKQANVHYFKRFVDRGEITSSAIPFATTFTFGLRFRLLDVPNYTEFTAIYDMYQLCAVKIMFIPIADVALVNAGAVSQVPSPGTAFMYRMLTAIDYNDFVAPASLDAIREYKNCKVTPNNRIHKRYFRPKPVTMIYQTSGTSINVGTANNTWLSTAGDGPAVEHYGMKCGFEQQPDAPTPRYRVECHYYMKFKNPK